ncbi:MAG: ATP-binding protein [bacterium]|nr:ATP-binding protein [bacterium]
MTKSKPTPKPSQPPQPSPAAGFVSLRWSFLSPLFLAALAIATIGAYLVARNLSGGLVISQESVLLESSRAVAERATALYNQQRTEAQRVAFTIGVPEAARDENATALEPMLESLARVGGLDAVIVTDSAGREVLGIQRVTSSDDSDYALSTATDLSQQAIIRAVLDEAYVGATGLLRTPGGVMLFTAVPINLGDQFVGIALVGQQVANVIQALKGSAVADLALYGPDGALLQTTFDDAVERSALSLAPEVFTQAALAVQQIPLQTLQLEQIPYQAAYQPFSVGPNTLGVVGAFMPDYVPFMTETGRQLTALLAAALAGGVVLVAYVGISRVAARATRVQTVAASLAVGEVKARTGMAARDEISAIGQALDQYADVTQEKQDALQQALRRQRREVAHLTAVLEAMPEGVVVQDMDGRVVLMNDKARHLLGSHRVFRSSGLHELSGLAAQMMGAALSPGLYALGDPQRVGLDGRMLSAQAAAVMSPISDRRLATVILLRDITDHVRQERDREAMLARLAQDVQSPLAALGRTGARIPSDMVNVFAREVTRHAIALQKMIVDLRELSTVDTLSVRRAQRPLRLETLVWAVANEWRQIAAANRLSLHVLIERRGLYVLGDEKRLRWAIGNLVDNAIKYTLPGGALTLEIRAESDGMANLRIRDNGVGIVRDEREHVFTRFFRGRPTTADGRTIQVPGMGQGLYVARQIIDAHGGKIWLKSTQGVGTAVYFTLPLTAPVTLEMPDFASLDLEGDTVRLPENFLIELGRD